MGIVDNDKYTIKAVVEKRERKDGPVYQRQECYDNLRVQTGRDRAAGLLIGDGTVGLNSNAVRLGVGNSGTAASVSDTNLGSNEYYQVMDTSFPSVTDNVATFRAEYGDTEANFAWECWGLDVDASETASAGSTVNELYNRKVFDFGTKDGGVWTLTVTITQN